MNSGLVYPKAHLWLIIPFLLTIAGFYMSYWSVFTDAPWRQHMHGLTATAWYLLLILQPWLIHNRPAKYHKKLGLVALFLAGGVVFSAFQVMPYQVVNDFLPDMLKYGFSFADICALTGFSIAVIMGVLSARDSNKHARWMISTVFWVLLPATGRLLYFPLLAVYDGSPPITYIQAAYICFAAAHLVLLYLIVMDYKKQKKIYTSYLFAFIGVAFYTFAIAPMGKWQWWIDFCHAVIGKGM